MNSLTNKSLLYQKSDNLAFVLVVKTLPLPSFAQQHF